MNITDFLAEKTKHFVRYCEQNGIKPNLEYYQELTFAEAIGESAIKSTLKRLYRIGNASDVKNIVSFNANDCTNVFGALYKQQMK